jgi:hypothetical protein
MNVAMLRRHFQLVRGPAFSSKCSPLEGGAPERENGPRATRAIEREQARKGLFSFVPMPSKKRERDLLRRPALQSWRERCETSSEEGDRNRATLYAAIYKGFRSFALF